MNDQEIDDEICRGLGYSEEEVNLGRSIYVTNGGKYVIYYDPVAERKIWKETIVNWLKRTRKKISEWIRSGVRDLADNTETRWKPPFE